MVKITEGSSDRTFKLNGVDYNKDTYEIYYNTKFVTERIIKESLLNVGIRNRFQVNLVLQHPVPVNKWVNDSDVPYNTVSDLIIDLAGFINFNTDGWLGLTQKVNTYDDLLSGEDLGDLAYVDVSQGTAWLPDQVGGIQLSGTYYPAGWYVWNGTEWVSDRNAIANQLENNVINNAQVLNEVNSLKDVIIPAIVDRVVILENEDHLLFETLPELP